MAVVITMLGWVVFVALGIALIVAADRDPDRA